MWNSSKTEPVQRCFRFCFALFAGVVIAALPVGCNFDEKRAESLILFCAAGMKVPISEIARKFEAEHGVPVEIRYGGSGALLTSLKIASGDLYLAADSSYIDLAREEGLVSSAISVGRLKAGFGVAKGNPLQVTELVDLKTPDLRIGIGNPEAASIGKFTKEILSEHQIWDSLEVTALFPTVNELTNAKAIGAIDVAILWDAMAHQYPEIEFVSVPEFDAEIKEVTISVLASSTQPQRAFDFCRFIAASDRGQVILEEHGYMPIEGQPWKSAHQETVEPGRLVFRLNE